jgi:hypothetical protein
MIARKSLVVPPVVVSPVPFCSLLVLHCHVNGGCPRSVELHDAVWLHSCGGHRE